MTVAKFATNNLVKEHDEYVKFMENREKELKESNASSYVLFYKKRLLNGAPTNKNNSLYRAINKWHCIMLSYEIWCELVKPHVRFTFSTDYKQIVDVPINILKEFKTQTEKVIKLACCDINTKGSHVKGKFDACRYLAMYWTYLDIIKDTKTQRFIPNNATIKRAAEIFGYKSDENPFKMNGVYWNWNKEEEQPVEEKTEVNDDILTTPIRDLNFTIRTFNCLYRSKILTLGDICMKSQRQLLKVRNLGRNSLNEIKAKLAEYDYYYMDLDSNAQKAHPEEESAVDIAEKVAETLGIQSPSEVLGGMNENPEMKPIVSVDEYDELYTKYNDIQIGLSEMSKRYENIFKEKTDLQQELVKANKENTSLKDTLTELSAKYQRLFNQLNEHSKFSTEDDDIFGLITNTIRMMKVKKMPYISLQLDGYEVNIKLPSCSSGGGIVRDYSSGIFRNKED